MIEPMSSALTRLLSSSALLRGFCVAVILSVLLLVVPVSVALSAGLAATSVVIYVPVIIVLTVLLAKASASRPDKLLVVATLFIALFAFIVPQAAFWATAQRYNAPLRFDPLRYVTFSGVTNLQPTRTMVYKEVPGRQLNLAVYEPENTASPRPAVALLHGGGWRYGNYRETGEWPRRLTEAGYTVISIEYRLSSDTYHPWQDSPADVHDALLYIRQYSAELQIDTERIALMGQSAGGHLALLEAYRSGTASAVIALYAPVDLALDYRTSRDKSAELDFIGGPPGQYRDRYRSLSPITYVDTAAARTLLVQGTYDDLVSPGNARLLADALRNKNVPHRIVMLPLTGHSFENQLGGFATQITAHKVITFLQK